MPSDPLGKTQRPPRRHHYIPQFYLRRWTGADGQLERYTKPIPGKLEIKRVSTKAVGWWENLYRAPENDPQKDQYLERFFFRALDDQAARVFEKLNCTPVPQLSENEVSIWSTFVMSLMHRTPEGMDAYKETGRRVWDRTVPDVRNKYDELRGADDPKTVEEYEASLTSDDAERSLMRNFAHVVTNPNIGKFLNNLHWMAFHRAHDTPYLLLSDDPLARSNGLKRPDGHLALPVSPSRLIVGVYDRDFVKEIRSMGRSALFTNMNIQTVEGARHFVVSTDRRQSRFIANRFGKNPRPGFARSSADHAFDIPDNY
jgi:hypothetical protein